MLRRTDPVGLGTPRPALQRPGGRVTERTRWLWMVPLVVGVLTVFGWVASHDPGKGLALSNRGWLTIAAAAALAILLSVHRTEGLGHLVRVLAEYAVVALLAVLVATSAAGVARHAPAAPDTRPQARAQAAGDACPSVAHVREWLTCLWQAGQDAARSHPPTTAPRKGR